MAALVLGVIETRGYRSHHRREGIAPLFSARGASVVLTRGVTPNRELEQTRFATVRRGFYITEHYIGSRGGRRTLLSERKTGHRRENRGIEELASRYGRRPISVRSRPSYRQSAPLGRKYPQDSHTNSSSESDSWIARSWSHSGQRIEFKTVRYSHKRYYDDCRMKSVLTGMDVYSYERFVENRKAYVSAREWFYRSETYGLVGKRHQSYHYARQSAAGNASVHSKLTALPLDCRGELHCLNGTSTLLL